MLLLFGMERDKEKTTFVPLRIIFPDQVVVWVIGVPKVI